MTAHENICIVSRESPCFPRISMFPETKSPEEAVIKCFAIEHKQNKLQLLNFPTLKRDSATAMFTGQLVSNFRDVDQPGNI